MTVIVLLINYPNSTITVVHWNDDSNETLFSSYLLGPYNLTFYFYRFTNISNSHAKKKHFSYYYEGGLIIILFLEKISYFLCPPFKLAVFTNGLMGWL